MKLTRKDIAEALDEVWDPELHISIVELGLIYNIILQDNDKVKIEMTLTSLGCPLFPMIEREVQEKLTERGILKENIEIVLTFEPPWSIELMSENARALMGI